MPAEEFKDIENLIEKTRRIKAIQDRIDLSQERIQEQIEISGNPYQPSDGDMVELPDGSVGGIAVAIPDKEGKYPVVLEDGIEVKAPAGKMLLRGCWTARKQR